MVNFSYGLVLTPEEFSSFNSLEMKKLYGETVMVDLHYLSGIIKIHPGGCLGMFWGYF